MKNLFMIINLACYVVYFFYSIYFVHVSEKMINKIAYGILLFAASIAMVTFLIPNDSALYHSNFGETYSWQRIGLAMAFAYKCITDFICQLGTEKFRAAFVSSKPGKIS